MVNKELLKTTLDLIKVKPEEHNQNNWVNTSLYSPCGTTMCFAGHAAVLSGAEIPDPKKHHVDDWYVGPNGEYINWSQKQYLTPSEFTPIGNFAQQKLGLSTEQADYLFGPDIDVEDIEAAVYDLMNDRDIAGLYNEDDYDDDHCPCCNY